MGDLNKKYCEGCKIEYPPATYSVGSESGYVEQHAAVWKKTGAMVESVSIDLCDTCYPKMVTWITGKISTAASAWDIANPVVKALVPPNL